MVDVITQRFVLTWLISNDEEAAGKRHHRHCFWLSAQAAAKAGLMDKAAKDVCGDGLKRVCELADIPPVLHMGSCVDISRMLVLAATLAKDAGLHISQLPVVGCAPEWMSEKAVSIGNYVIGSGIDTFLA